MKQNALNASKTPLLYTGCISYNQNTDTTGPKIFDQSGTFFGGGRQPNFYSTLFKPNVCS